MEDANYVDKLPDSNQEDAEVVASPLCILVTDADKYGTDIADMSDFFDIYIQQLSTEIQNNASLEGFEYMSVVDFGIIRDALQQLKAVMTPDFTLFPDFEHLPKEIKENLEKGVYTVGESKQVDGNLRAVILDENKVRIKDITLKKVATYSGTIETSRSITTQLQLKQISMKLDEIQEMQSYQIDRDRDRDLKTPFLNARDYILRAQGQVSQEERKQLLFKASEELTSALNGIYTDMDTAGKHLATLTGRPIFRRQKQINCYMGYLAEDMQISAKFVGVQMHVLEYLRDYGGAQQVSQRYHRALRVFLRKE